MTTLKTILLISIWTMFLTGCATSDRRPAAQSDDWHRPITDYQSRDTAAVQEDDLQFFSTPEDLHKTFLEWIEAAQLSIEMEMFHLTDKLIVNALLAKNPNVKITLILDWKNIQSPASAAIVKSFEASGHITVVPSSKMFSLTHTKAMVIDGTTALITSINLTTLDATTRDYGVVTHNQGIITEMQNVFRQDITNATLSPQTADTPMVSQPNLIWSNKNSESGLLNLIYEAQSISDAPKSRRFIHATVENIGDPTVSAAFAAVARGAATSTTAATTPVDVRLIVPECAMGTGNNNYKYFSQLPGVKIRVAPAKASAEAPYMHGKMILLGNHRAYLGSVNYSTNSIHNDRELGIIFTNTAATDQLDGLFWKDWNTAADLSYDAGGKLIVPKCPGF